MTLHKAFILQTCLLLFCLSMATASTIHVGAAGTFHQIKPAIAHSVAGDTILVSSGIYKEGNILIDKSIFLIGLGLPIIDGDKQYEVITITADHVVVEGFRVQHSGHGTLDDPGGIKIRDSKYVSILRNELYDNFFGIYVQYSQHCLLKDNKIMGLGKEEQEIGNGIHCWKSDSLQIIGNRITGHRDGIYFEFVTHSIIWRNNSHDNIRYGLHFMFSNNDSYVTNIFKGNGAGVAVMFTKNVTMANNIFSDNWGDASYGLLLKEISDSQIIGNRFIDNTSGIFMEGTNRILLEKNVFSQNGWAMQIQASCMDNIITDNNFLANSFDIGTNGTVVLNTFDHNYWDRYEGYDLNKDGIGDLPFRPLSLYSVIIENIPSAMLLYRSFIVTLLDKSEKIFPTLTPDNFVDRTPLMKPIRL
jgi:nitrous oxidase accessory protein